MSSPDAVVLSTLSLADILTRRRSLRRQLSAQPGLLPVRIAILGGSTTQELADLLELQLLASGLQPVIYQSGFGRFHDEAVHDNQALRDFAPQLIYIHSSVFNIQSFPPMSASESQFEAAVESELARFQQIWSALDRDLGCLVIQNNFEFPPQAILGNLDAVSSAGHTRLIAELNRRFAQAAATRHRLLLHDLCSVSARVGLDCWFDLQRWFSFKLPFTPRASHACALSLAAMVRAVFGRARKVLVLDLDNTLWGGIIGEDGPERIQLGRDTPLAEAYTAFQQYCLSLRSRGVLLAVCSKNDDATARQGFEHPDSLLRIDHLSSFKANWLPKPENLIAISNELGLGLESFVFVDDNPAERALVARQLPSVAVPELGADVAAYPALIEAGRYFESVCLSSEDLARASRYSEDQNRTAAACSFQSYQDFLESLEMTAEIDILQPVYLQRVAQLTARTNQFNLTSRRYTLPELEQVLTDPSAIALYGRLADRFGDHGLISVLLGHLQGFSFHIDLWLMSCRVLKRDMELAMFDSLVTQAQAAGATEIRGTYLPTPRNGLVADLYPSLGFELLSRAPAGESQFRLRLDTYTPRNRHIRVVQPATVPVLAAS